MIGPSARAGDFHPAARHQPQADFHPGRSYFDALARPFGTASIDLRLGPIRMRLEGLSGVQARSLRERFRPFTTEGRGQADLTIGLSGAPVARFLRLPVAGDVETYRLESRSEGGRISLWSYEFAGWVEAASRRARLDLVEAGGDLFDRGLENFLRVMTAFFVLERGGFLLHGSAVVREGKAYIFFGPSGSGKTTVTDLSPGDLVLSDDLTLVVPDSGKGYVAAGIPFGMAHHRVPDSGGCFPIVSFNRLVQSQSVRREPIRGAQAVAEVASSLPFVMQETRQASRAMEVLSLALGSVPVYRLFFRKDGAFWNAVEES
jgi:hypothetical protein